MRPSTFILLSVLAAGLLAAPAHATLIGQQVNGSLVFTGNPLNYFLPANGFVPAGFGNSGGQPVTISNALTEFGFNDGANRDTADFTATQLIFTDVSTSNSNNPVTASFTSVAPGAFTSLALVSSNISGLTFSLVGNTISLAYPGFTGPGTFSATFNVGSPGSVPEPASLALLAAGLLGTSGAAWLRRRQPPSRARSAGSVQREV